MTILGRVDNCRNSLVFGTFWIASWDRRASSLRVPSGPQMALRGRRQFEPGFHSCLTAADGQPNEHKTAKHDVGTGNTPSAKSADPRRVGETETQL